MNKYLNPAFWGRALAHPLVLIGLVVDLLPIYAVFAWGWTAVPLVLLYWVENVLAGITTLPRILVSGASFGGKGFFLGLFMCVFFTLHYGLFCAVHGIFLFAFVSMAGAFRGEAVTVPDMDVDIPKMVEFAFTTGQHFEWIVGAILAFHLLVFVWEFLIKGRWKDSNPMAEMFAPYGRIIILHFGIFAGAGALFLLGQPMWGVLGLILFRAAWGVISNARQVEGVPILGDFDKAMDQLTPREQFEKAMRGESVEPPGGGKP